MLHASHPPTPFNWKPLSHVRHAPVHPSQLRHPVPQTRSQVVQPPEPSEMLPSAQAAQVPVQLSQLAQLLAQDPLQALHPPPSQL